MSIYYGKNNKRIPTDLDDCLQQNETVSSLRYWAERTELLGAVLLGILIIAGIITSIVESVNVAEVNEDLAFVTFLTSALTWGLYAFIEYCTYRMIALLINAFATHLEHTVISSNITLMKAYLDPNIPKNDVKPQTTPTPQKTSILKSKANKPGWICPHCGDHNSGQNVRCEMCGQARG